MGSTTHSTGAVSKFSEVKIEVLKSDNYFTWKVQMKAALVLRRLWFTIEHDGRWRALTDEEQEELSEQAKALITVYVSTGLLSLVTGYACAYDVWHGLERVFRTQSIGRKFALHEQLRSVKKKSSESVLVYVARAENLREELAGSCEDTVPEDLFFSYILSGLGPRFADISKQIRYSGLESMTLESLKGRLMLAESELYEGNVGRQDTVNATMDGKELRRCFGCGQIGHIKANCPDIAGKRKPDRGKFRKVQSVKHHRKPTLPNACFSVRLPVQKAPVSEEVQRIVDSVARPEELPGPPPRSWSYEKPSCFWKTGDMFQDIQDFGGERLRSPSNVFLGAPCGRVA
jgi:hypothetical protein